MQKKAENTAGLCCLDSVEEHIAGQRGLFFCSPPLDAIINGREQRDGEPIRSRLACQPKTNCLLALTAGFYLHNSNPKAKGNLHFANSERRGRVYEAAHGGRSDGGEGEGEGEEGGEEEERHNE